MATTITGSGVDNIIDGTITNADINASAGIVGSKLSGAGKVLQVVSTNIDTFMSTTSNSYTPTSINLSITPSSTNSKILVSMDVICTSSMGSWSVLRLYRGIGGSYSHISQSRASHSTNMYGIDSSGFLSTFYNPSDTHHEHTAVMRSGKYLDSPNTTASVDYKLYWRVRDGNTAYINQCSSGTSGDHLSHGVSSVTLMEIGA
jgi:hypothetical protein